MSNKALSVLKGRISHIQLKLSDFSKGDLEPGKIITERFTERTRPHNINERLILLPGNHFDLVNPVCPFCGSNHVIKQEYYERNPILGEFGPQKIYLKRYLCKKCRKKFITPFDSVIKPKHRTYSISCGLSPSASIPRKIKTEAVTPSGVIEDIVLQKMQLPKASVVSPNQKQTYISTPYSKINRKL